MSKSLHSPYLYHRLIRDINFQDERGCLLMLLRCLLFYTSDMKGIISVSFRKSNRGTKMRRSRLYEWTIRILALVTERRISRTSNGLCFVIPFSREISWKFITLLLETLRWIIDDRWIIRGPIIFFPCKVNVSYAYRRDIHFHEIFTRGRNFFFVERDEIRFDSVGVDASRSPYRRFCFNLSEFEWSIEITRSNEGRFEFWDTRQAYSKNARFLKLIRYIFLMSVVTVKIRSIARFKFCRPT